MRHELHLTRVGLRALALALVPAALVGAVVAGRWGVYSVALGVAIVAANQVLAAMSTGWSRRLGYATLATGYVGFALRMYAVLVAFTFAARVASLHRTLFVTSFMAAMTLALAAECWSFARKTYVPRWRMAR